MRTLRCWLASVLLAACAAPHAVVTSVDGVTCIDGITRRPLAPAPGALHVLLFLTTDCPIANAYAPTIQALRTEFEPRGVQFFLVHVDAQLDAAAARGHAQAYGHRAPILVDRRHELVLAVGATITPEAAVVTAGGAVAYRGRIDDWFGDIGKKRPAPTSHELRDALAALTAGRAPDVARTQAIGCDISP